MGELSPALSTYLSNSEFRSLKLPYLPWILLSSILCFNTTFFWTPLAKDQFCVPSAPFSRPLWWLQNLCANAGLVGMWGRWTNLIQMPAQATWCYLHRWEKYGALCQSNYSRCRPQVPRLVNRVSQDSGQLPGQISAGLYRPWTDHGQIISNHIFCLAAFSQATVT